MIELDERFYKKYKENKKIWEIIEKNLASKPPKKPSKQRDLVIIFE